MLVMSQHLIHLDTALPHFLWTNAPLHAITSQWAKDYTSANLKYRFHHVTLIILGCTLSAIKLGNHLNMTCSVKNDPINVQCNVVSECRWECATKPNVWHIFNRLSVIQFFLYSYSVKLWSYCPLCRILLFPVANIYLIIWVHLKCMKADK